MGAMAKRVLLVFLFVIISATTYVINDSDSRKIGTELTNIRIKRNLVRGISSLISKTMKWTLQVVRVVKARNILLADARLFKTDDGFQVSWYGKQGGWERAERDFLAMGGCRRKYKARLDLNGQSDVSKYGTAGENTVQLIKRFSDEFPYPAIFMYKKVIWMEVGGITLLFCTKQQFY